MIFLRLKFKFNYSKGTQYIFVGGPTTKDICVSLAGRSPVDGVGAVVGPKQSRDRLRDLILRLRDLIFLCRNKFYQG